MQVVILAAGMGLRLGHLTRVTPKAMISVNEVVLLDYALSPLLADKRVEEIIVVGGFQYEMIAEHIESRYAAFGDRIRVVQNRDFKLGNLFTLKAALPFLSSSFLICNADHIYSEATWKESILASRDSVSIFCDFLRQLASDEMKVSLSQPDKKFVAMSKTLQDYDCGYVGLTYVPKNRLEAYRKAVESTLMHFGEKAVVENVLPILASEQNENIAIVPFDKYRWYEVDTREDLIKAEAALQTLAEQAGSDSQAL